MTVIFVIVFPTSFWISAPLGWAHLSMIDFELSAQGAFWRKYDTAKPWNITSDIAWTCRQFYIRNFSFKYWVCQKDLNHQTVFDELIQHVPFKFLDSRFLTSEIHWTRWTWSTRTSSQPRYVPGKFLNSYNAVDCCWCV